MSPFYGAPEQLGSLKVEATPYLGEPVLKKFYIHIIGGWGWLLDPRYYTNHKMAKPLLVDMLNGMIWSSLS